MFDGGLAGAQVRNLLQEIGTLLERAGDELLDGIFEALSVPFTLDSASSAPARCCVVSCFYSVVTDKRARQGTSTSSSLDLDSVAASAHFV